MVTKKRKHRKAHKFSNGGLYVPGANPTAGMSTIQAPNSWNFGSAPTKSLMQGIGQYGGAAMSGLSSAYGLYQNWSNALEVPEIQQIASNGINYNSGSWDNREDREAYYMSLGYDEEEAKMKAFVNMGSFSKMMNRKDFGDFQIQQATADYFDTFKEGLDKINEMTIDTSSMEDSIQAKNFQGTSTTDLMNQWGANEMYDVDDFMEQYDFLDEQRANYQNSLYEDRLGTLGNMSYTEETAAVPQMSGGDVLKSVGGSAASGAGLGATLGSVVPGIGNVVGGVVGGVVGAIGGAFSSWFGGNKRKKAEEERQRIEGVKRDAYNTERDATIDEIEAMQEYTADLRADQRVDTLDTFTDLTESANKSTILNFSNAAINANKNKLFALNNSYNNGGYLHKFEDGGNTNELDRSFTTYKVDPSLGIEGNAKILRNKQKEFAKQWYEQRATVPGFEWIQDYLPQVNNILDSSKYIAPNEFFSNPNNYINAEELQEYIDSGKLTPASLSVQGRKGTRGAANPKELTYTNNFMPIPFNIGKFRDVEWHEGIGHLLGDNIGAFLDTVIPYQNRYDETVDPKKATYSQKKNERHADVWGFRGANADLKDEQGNYYIDPNRKLNAEDIQKIIDAGGLIPMGMETLTLDEIANLHNTTASVDKVINPFEGIFGTTNDVYLSAEGGPINSNSNSPIEINEGGLHEENPYEGVQMGIAPDGIPNLVEEGEVIFNDYVYSNRLKPTKEMKRKNKYRGKTFADAAKYISKESNERPNDPISQRGLEIAMNRLSQLQETIKAKKEMQRLNKQYANGGRLFDNGGYKKYSNYTNIGNDWYTKEYMNFVNSLKEGDKESLKWLDRINKGEFGDIGGNTFKSIADIQRLATDGKLGPIHKAMQQAAAQYDIESKITNPLLSRSGEYVPIVDIPVDYSDWDVEEEALPVPTSRSNNGTSSKKGIGKYLPYLQYAPAVVSGIGAISALASKPDYSNADIIGNLDLSNDVDLNYVTPSNYQSFLTQTKADAALTGAQTISDYLSYDPLDTNYTLNKMNQQAAATRRAIMNTSGGNSAAARAALLAADYNAKNAVGEALRQDAQYNQAMKERVAAFNRGTNQYNADAITRAAMANQQAKNSVALANAQMEAQRKQALVDAAYKADNMKLSNEQLKLQEGNLRNATNQLLLSQAAQEAAMRNQIETLHNQNKNSAISGFASDLFNIGRNAISDNWMEDLIGSGALQWIKAEGGKLKRTKSKNKRKVKYYG